MTAPPDQKKGGPACHSERHPKTPTTNTAFAVNTAELGIEDGRVVPVIDGIRATEFDEAEIEPTISSEERDRVGLRMFFDLVQEEASHGSEPTFQQIYVAFVAAAHLAGAPFALGSTRELASICGVTHETLNRRIKRLQRRLRIFRPEARVKNRLENFGPNSLRDSRNGHENERSTG